MQLFIADRSHYLFLPSSKLSVDSFRLSFIAGYLHANPLDYLQKGGKEPLSNEFNRLRQLMQWVPCIQEFAQ